MSRSGEELGADLGNLYEVGNYMLPTISSVYAHAGSELFHVGSISAALARDPALGGTYGPAGALIDSFCEALTDVLIQTSINVNDTGMALVMATREYAATDAQAAATLLSKRTSLDNVYGQIP